MFGKKQIDKVKDIHELRDYLQLALQIEFSTIPPYLLALYSIKPGKNQGVSELIRSIVVEEMLHMTLVVNILNSIGGTPKLNESKYIPSYPYQLPIRCENEFLTLHLKKLSPETVRTFLLLEKIPPISEIRSNLRRGEAFTSLAELYQTIKEALIYFSLSENLFVGDINKQITSEYYYQSGGEIVVVSDLESALSALDQVIENSFGEENISVSTKSHYDRFLEILGIDNGKTSFGQKLQVDWDEIYDVSVNIEEYRNNNVLLNKINMFNQLYSKFLLLLHEAFNGKPELLVSATQLMFSLRVKAIELINQPLLGSKHASPLFEFVEEARNNE